MRKLKNWTVLPNGTLVRPCGKHVPTNKPLANGYLQVSVSYQGERIMMRQHRVAHYLRTGEWPEMIDHINGIKHDNSEGNLRSSDRVANQRNQQRHRENTCGITSRLRNGKLHYRIRLRANGIQHERTATNNLMAASHLREMKKVYWNEET